MNILFFITPKSELTYAYDDDTLRQVLEKLDRHPYSTIPVINETTGYYVGTLTEGDLLRDVKAHYDMSLKDAEERIIAQIPRKRDYLPVSADADIEDLLLTATNQNFVPVIDDSGIFIGIITRKEVMQFLMRSLGEKDGTAKEGAKAQPEEVREVLMAASKGESHGN